MAKNFITGSARSPSTEEFKARIARLSEMPTHATPAANARKNRPAKQSFSQQPLRREPDGATEENATDEAEKDDVEKDGGETE
ncbi:hypothetical protein DK419_02645 [Methylobacterium terrae]|uniref:Uncharacterized protein n=1 Tax=Methylobacterium terrae TaxID=2202827 RepID=A0A2U8WJG5_9HYPH|nr:hypothetical protein [Methylobacterium terrae]AWN45352.1 hypothetical protein DK419_02645 [Methylobacterium terrae]